MKFNKVYFPIVFFLVIQNFVSSEVFWCLGALSTLFYIVAKRKWKMLIPQREIAILVVFVIWGAILGIVDLSQNINSTRDFVRDLFYYTNPIIFIFVGAQYAKDNVGIYRILNSFIVGSGILSVIKFANLFVNRNLLLSAFSVFTWRTITGDAVVVMGMTIAIVLSGIIPFKERLSSKLNIICFVLTGLYFLISLSRTNIMIVAIMYAVLVLDKANVMKTIKKILSACIVLIIAVFILNSVLPSNISEAFIQKMFSSITEINAKNTWSSTADIQENWRGYETYCAVKQWNTNGLFSQVFGAGFGTRIEVGPYAYSLLGQTINGSPATSIAVLHNGYATQLIKLGCLGVILYLSYYGLLIRKGLHGIKKEEGTLARLLLAIAIILVFQTYFLNGLFKDYCFYPLIITIGYCGYVLERNGRVR